MAKEQPEGSVSTRLIDRNLIETTYKGYISVQMIQDVLTSLDALLKANPGSDWLIDSLEATGIAPAPHPTRMAIFETFKRRGGNQIAGVVRSAPMRMIAVTFAFAFGLPLKVFETRHEALAHLGKQREKGR